MKFKFNKAELYIISGLFLWGIICSIVLVYPYLTTPGTGWIASWRCDRLVERYNDLVNYGQFDIAHNSHVLGYGLYFPFIMRQFHIYDGLTMYCLAQSLCGMVVIMFYPFLVYKMHNNLLLSLISPVLVHLFFGDMLYINKSGEYFASLFSLALGIPLLIIIFQSKKQKQIIGYSLFLIVIAMLSNIMRDKTAFPVVFIWLIILLLKCRSHIVKIVPAVIMIGILLFSFSFLSTTFPQIIANKWGVEGKIAYNSSPWHSILIGMGYVWNDYGLYYGDDAGKEIVEKYYPDVVYNSEGYFEKCKEIALDIICKDPLFVLKGLIKKTIVSFIQNIECTLGLANETVRLYRILSIILCVGALFVVSVKRKLIAMLKDSKYCYFVVFAILISNYTGILASPTYYYNWGACGGGGILLFVFLMESVSFAVASECQRDNKIVLTVEENS